MAHLISDWNPLGVNIYYRKKELYSMGWSNHINLSDFMIAAAPYGGPIALVRDEKKIVKATSGGKPTIYIFSSSGQSIQSFQWSSGKLLQMAWSNQEELLCIQDDGMVLVYDIFGSLQGNFSLGQEVRDTKVLESKVYSTPQGTGVAVLTGSYRFFLVNNIQDPKSRRMAEIPGLDAPPSSWAVFAVDRESKVLVAKDTQLFILHHMERTCQPVYPEFNTKFLAITEMALSPNSKDLALFTDSGILWMGSSNFEQKYCEFETRCQLRPEQLVWCGNHAVLAHWQSLLLVIGPEKHYINYTFDSPFHIVPEIDGARIITNTTLELLQKVPNVVFEVLRIGSIAPGGLLLEASKEFQKRSHKADDYITMIREKEQMEAAVMQCIDAAGYEWNASVQKMLLRAAKFGKGFVPTMNRDALLHMCQKLRVLNSVREHTIGIPLTIVQLDTLSMRTLLDRLVMRRQYELAIQVCHHLRIPESEGASRILAHWACFKVKQSDTDGDKVAAEIARKLGDTPGISYSEIAHQAVNCGKKQIAIRLLDFEPRASKQVPLLLKLKQDDEAMNKAIASGDSNLVMEVIHHLKEKQNAADFLRSVNNFPVAYALYLKLCRESSIEQLRDMYYQESNFNAEADCYIIESYQTKIPERRLANLQAALDCYKKGRSDFAVQQTDDQMRLLKYQMKLRDKLSHKYIDLSVSDTIKQLIYDKELKLAEDLHKEFKVPEKRYWWVKISALAETVEWMELDKFSKSKKSPIGYEPLVDICMKHGNRYEAQKYIPKVKEENKVKYYCKVGLLEDAAKFAFSVKDEVALLYVQKQCGITNRAVSEKIESMKAQLGKR